MQGGCVRWGRHVSCGLVDWSKLISISVARVLPASCPGRRRGDSWFLSPRWDLRRSLKVGADQGGSGGFFPALIWPLLQGACKNLSSSLGPREQCTSMWELIPHRSGAPRQTGDGGVQGWAAGESVWTCVHHEVAIHPLNNQQIPKASRYLSVKVSSPLCTRELSPGCQPGFWKPLPGISACWMSAAKCLWPPARQHWLIPNKESVG